MTYAQTKVYKGEINNQDEIEIHLLISNKDTCGYYFYKDKKTPIPLRAMRGSGKLKLAAGGALESSAWFEGLIEGPVFKGAWHDSKSLPFELTQVNTETVGAENKKINGSYIIEDSSQSKDVDMICMNDSYLFVELSLGAENCAAYFVCIAKIQSPGKASYSDAQCKKLAFAISGQTLRVTETGCDSYHGADCRFAGVYQRDK